MTPRAAPPGASTFDAVTLAELPSRELTELHLLRHGQVETGGLRLAYGHADLPLSRVGRAESEALVGLGLTLPRPDGVLSSDRVRCLDVARPLAERLRVPLQVEPALREQHMGAWEGRSWAEITTADPAGTHAYWASYRDARPPGGESMDDLADRVGAWWAEAWPWLRGRRWLVVTHIGVIRVLLCRFLARPLDEALRYAPPRGSHTRVLLAEAGAVLEILGERPTLLPPRPLAGARPRLALSGSAGTGKTTLGRALAETFDVPFIPEGMRSRLEAGLNLHSLTHTALRSLVEELWAEQLTAESAAIAHAGGFVADRSSVDFAAFWLHYRFTDDVEATTTFLGQTLAHAASYDQVVLLPWGCLPLVADGVRSSNPWLQRHFQATVEGLLAREVPPGLALQLPPLTSLDARVRWVVDRL